MTPEAAVARLTYIVAAGAELTEDDVYAEMAAAGVPEPVADRAWKFTQIAWGRVLLDGMGVRFSPDYFCFDASGEVIESGRLSEEPYFIAAMAAAPRAGATPGFLQLALTSADATAVNDALNAGSAPEDLDTGPAGLFMEAPTQAGLDRARKLLAQHASAMSAPAASPPPPPAPGRTGQTSPSTSRASTGQLPSPSPSHASPIDPVTVTCPACRERVTPDGVVCPRCGASVAAEVFAAHAEKMRALLARAPGPPRSGGSTVNGWGTTLLDYRPRGDGSWDAVKWVTMAWVPLVPLRALRIRPGRREALIAGQNYHYEVLEEGKPPLARVLRVYGMALAAFLPVLFAFLRMDTVNRLVGSGPGFFVTLATIVWLGFVMTRFINADKAYQAATETSPEAPAAG